MINVAVIPRRIRRSPTHLRRLTPWLGLGLAKRSPLTPRLAAFTTHAELRRISSGGTTSDCGPRGVYRYLYPAGDGNACDAGTAPLHALKSARRRHRCCMTSWVLTWRQPWLT